MSNPPELLEISSEDIISLHLTIDQSNHSVYLLKVDQIEEAEERDLAIFVLSFVKAKSGKYVLYPGYPTTDA